MCHYEAGSLKVSRADHAIEVQVPLASGESFPATLLGPGRSAPGVVLLTDFFGPSPFYAALAVRLANAGYHTLVPDLFFREGELGEFTREAAAQRRTRLDDSRTIHDLSAVFDWLAKRREVSGERVGVIGCCLGGTFALCLAAERVDLATVAYYGFPRPSSVGRNPIPAPVERISAIHGPVLAFWGESDQAVGLDNAVEFAERLSSREIDFEHRIYPGLGHGFLGQALDDSAHDGHELARHSWERTLAFLDEYLDAESPDDGAGAMLSKEPERR